MHGRLKVRTSAEEAARKQKERNAKAAAFRAGMERILAKKERAELDEELMLLTGKILSANPDVAMLWNLRRQCLQTFAKADEETGGQSLFDKDLSFTEMCLQVNPKSYCAWHHRCWVLENCPTPNWDKEVELCTKYLKMDERNFHCWDYRRYVVAKANVAPAKELEFCTEKIQNNFSNYSSWHYRSKLLPILHPNKEDPSRPISEEKLKEELELVLTAAFTDPGDSSAWFYQRWLLGYSQPELDLAAFRMDTAKGLAVVTFTRPVNLKHKDAKLEIEGLDSSANWQSACFDDSYSVTWILRDATPNLPNQLTFPLTFTDEFNQTHTLELNKTSPTELFAIRKPKFGTEFGVAVVDVLKAQLESCQQLLEFEPDSKWTLLTAALLSKAIDHAANHDQIVQYLEKLKNVDPMRTGYYQDLIGRWGTEVRLGQWIDGKGCPAERLDLSGIGLVHVAYEQYLAVASEIDLGGNKLAEKSLAKFGHFVFCKNLILKGNQIAGETEPKIRQICSGLQQLELV
ncbi:geranylgeranyl transferase type-2 subunit alpha isoform X2 [Culex pipiens pallens]|uniref:geranylgeranyl transferase type-2 subunit alpha isoform X2 n=1 Tax=Culex pipiens pallens TaxID=42434 RepID=UPI00195367AF|nr:geranylgeranyl transferase type-2 subunit alpha isoform X2 [Culex pipiens pallens]